MGDVTPDEHTMWRERQLMLNTIAELEAEVEQLRDTVRSEGQQRVSASTANMKLQAEVERLREENRHLLVKADQASLGEGLARAEVERMREENAALRARLPRSAPENAVSLPPVDEL